MASLGHIAVGMATARVSSEDRRAVRPSLGAMLFWAALSFLPDADVIGFGFGIRYQDEWGHRGASHSLVFALAVGISVGLLAPLFKRRPVRTGLIAALVVATHGLLDTLTDGGLGIALFWPFDLTRYFAPWTPIPVSPIGLGYLSPYGFYVFVTELTLFAPLIWFALSNAHRVRTLPVVAWLAAIWLLMSNDPLRNRIVYALMRDDTQFAEGFSEEKLASIAAGATSTDVQAVLGVPLREIPGGGGTCWVYSRSPDEGYFRARAVCFTDGRVTNVIRRWIR
jgi:inner membrane protein